MKQSNAVITEDMNVILEDVKNETMRTLRVGTVARVVSVDGLTVSVQPIVEEKINTPAATKYLQLPVIKGVYCVSGQTYAVGDYVVCLHFDRGLGDFDIFSQKSGYVESGTHRHDLGDCIAIKIKTTPEE